MLNINIEPEAIIVRGEIESDYDLKTVAEYLDVQVFDQNGIIHDYLLAPIVTHKGVVGHVEIKVGSWVTFAVPRREPREDVPDGVLRLLREGEKY